MNKSLQPHPKQDNEKSKLDLGFVKISKSSLPVIEKIFILVILALAVYFFLPKLSSLEDTITIVKSLNPWWVILAIASQILRAWGNGMTISECIKMTKQEFSTLKGALIFMASYSFGLVGGGMFGSAAITYRWVRVSGGNNEGASLAASIPSFFLSFVLSAVSIFGLVFLFINHNLSTIQLISYILISLFLAAVGILLIVALRNQEKSIKITVSVLSAIYKFFKKELPVGKVTRDVNNLFTAWNFLIQAGWKGPMRGSVISTFADILTIFFLFLACGNPVSMLVVITGYGLPNLFGRMAFMIPGGVGIIESTMVALYTSLGVENSVATVITLTYRLLSFWLPSITGFVLLPYFNRLISKNYEDLPE